MTRLLAIMKKGNDVQDQLLLSGARVVLPNGIAEDTDVLIASDGRISRITPRADGASARQVIELAGLTIYPGFIDIHIHGAVGVDTMEATTEDLHCVARFLAREGVTAWLPTLVPAPVEDYRSATQAIEKLIAGQAAHSIPAARALGLHYEGPFINAAQCGALRPAYFRTYMQASDVNDLPVAHRGQGVRLITVAPEIIGGIELVRELTARGWVVSIGHTRAGVETLEEAHAAGARHMTHFFNAMLPLNHRTPGPVGWGLMSDDVTCDIIADGQHVAPLMLQLALRCKTPDRLLLISDAVAPTGQGDGDFRIWGEKITVVEGRTENERGSIAGSVITMRDAVRRMLSLGLAPHEVARMASANPARLIGVTKECGSVEVGKRADLVALDGQGNVRLTLIGGGVAFDETNAIEG